MGKFHPLNIQCFVKRNIQSVFADENNPKLLYISQTHPEASVYPRMMHAHKDFVEIILICSGSSEYLIHNKKYQVKAGDLLVYNAGVVHDEISGPDRKIGSYCAAVGGLHMEGLRENALISDDAGYIFPTGDAFGDLKTLFEMMFRNLSSETQGAEEFCNYLMQGLLMKVLAVAGNKSLSPEKPLEEPYQLGQRIKKYIDAHYMEPITLQSIGTALNISTYYLSHIFKQMSGYSPMQYLLRRRIGEAQSLLTATDYSVLKISEMVGYETQSYFSLQFTKHVGMSPNQFRQNYIVQQKEKKQK